jgi:hypothetical protein
LCVVLLFVGCARERTSSPTGYESNVGKDPILTSALDINSIEFTRTFHRLSKTDTSYFSQNIDYPALKYTSKIHFDDASSFSGTMIDRKIYGLSLEYSDSCESDSSILEDLPVNIYKNYDYVTSINNYGKSNTTECGLFKDIFDKFDSLYAVETASTIDTVVDYNSMSIDDILDYLTTDGCSAVHLGNRIFEVTFYSPYQGEDNYCKHVMNIDTKVNHILSDNTEYNGIEMENASYNYNGSTITIKKLLTNPMNGSQDSTTVSFDLQGGN